MKRYKVSKRKRNEYIYYPWNEEIHLTKDDVGEQWLKYLHGENDREIDAERRENEHIPLRYDQYSDFEDGNHSDSNRLLADDTVDPLVIIIGAMDRQEHEDKIIRLRHAIEELSAEQKELIHKIFFERMTKTEVAKEEGVTETAIRNRLNRIFKKLRKNL